MNNPQKDLIKFILICAVVMTLFCVALKCCGADMTGGYIFTPTDRVTSTKLNSLVGSGSINVDFLTGKSTAHPIEADSFLFYQASSGLYRKDSFADGLLGSTNLIMLRTEDTAPATNDFVLTYDTSAGVNKRVALYNLWPSIGGLNEETTPPDIGYKTLIVSPSGQPFWSSMTNTLNQAYRHWQLANPSNAVSDPTNYYLSNVSSPVKTDALVIWNGNTNKYSTWSNLITRATAVTTLTGGDMALGYSTNQSQLVGIKAVDMQKWTTNYANSPTLALTNKLPQTWTTQGIALANGLLVNAAHGLGGVPQCVRWTLIVTDAGGDLGWGLNRELPIEDFFDSSTGKPWFVAESDGTTVILVAANTGTIQTRQASATVGTAANISTGKWAIKGYVTWFPTFP